MSSRPGPSAIELVPRPSGPGYRDEDLAARRSWVEERTGARLKHVGASTIPAGELRGNIENPVGAVQVPLGVAGPLKIDGEHARGTFYVPLATTEGTLVRSFERGMVALTRAGGATVRLWSDQNRISPIFTFPDVPSARELARRLPELAPAARAAAEATTGHGRLLDLVAHPAGRRVIVEMRFATGDASGMNLVARAAEAACARLQEDSGAEGFLLFSGQEGEKRPAGSLLAGGKGKTAVAGVRLPRRVVRAVLGVTPEALTGLWHETVVGHLHGGSLGYGGHLANGLTALYLACGQDVANVANSAVGVTDLELSSEGGLLATVTLPSLVVGTVGGGTGLPTSRECLEMIGCAGAGHAPKLAEIVAATVLAGELSFGAAVAAGELVKAHETYGRNRPPKGNTP
jgi:hydroxymethylglutaryl-CoA reductase (NADPH)